MAKEVDIFKMIKSRRYTHMALRFLLPKQVRLDLKKISHHVVVNPDEVVEEQQLLRMSTVRIHASVSSVKNKVRPAALASQDSEVISESLSDNER